ncbi:MAG: UvrD-helicase domain-containing protein [Bacillota bacterium]
MHKIFRGSAGSGKTTELLKKYHNIAEKTGTEDLLVFLSSAQNVRDFRENINLSVTGNLNIYTYFGFVNSEIVRHWPLIEKSITDDRSTIEPTFMTIETSHFLMSNYVEKFRVKKNFFKNIKAKSVQIAVQLIDNLNLAAFNLLSLEDMERRMIYSVSNDRERKNYIKESLKIMNIFREFCIKYRLLDYSLAVSFFNDYLLKNEDYLCSVVKDYKYVLVDDLEKTVPSGQKFIKNLIDNGTDGYLTYNEHGGFNRFFGGNPQLSKKLFLKDAETITDLKNYFAQSAENYNLEQQIKSVIEKGNEKIIESPLFKGEIDSELRGDMLIQLGRRIISLIESGVNVEDIAVISPQIDKVLLFSLNRILEKNGYKLTNLNKSKKLVDIPFARALVVLYLFYKNRTEMIGMSALQQTFSLLLELDPVRSSLLAEEIAAAGMKLIDIDDKNIREKIGFAGSERYDYLKDWLREKEDEELEIEHFFQAVFSQLLSPLNPSREDIFACKQMIESVARFREAVSNFHTKEEDLSSRYIDMIYEGTLAADTLFSEEEKEGRVILSSPYKFLFSPEISGVKYMFLIDISSENWMRSIAKELVNPYIFTDQWEVKKEWNDKIDQNIRRRQLSDFLINLINKVNKGIIFTDSFLNSMGWEQDGPLYKWIMVRRENDEL